MPDNHTGLKVEFIKATFGYRRTVKRTSTLCKVGSLAALAQAVLSLFRSGPHSSKAQCIESIYTLFLSPSRRSCV